ncbi:MAG: sigma-70 family RNA polymerase sigma factor [Tepidibacter sp.]|jgi:RNA polymerase sigma-70 factor (ECF subfamily)|uniref:RNA polymerase sigma factor n=1 Tax=Tepidibacter sp. TaxID=2529387 RepID=UPI0025E6C236|nr:sigma-70 family RNA polymerase sigma factor [Tepidibacter sp.]MCT4509035.1 sigma-70 family RNA polymerase sigma factor [Tepidibacter sp.]
MGIFFKRKKQDEIELYKILFETYNKKVYRVAYYILKNEEDAKDIVQDTFIQAFNKIDTLKDKNKFESWICAIASNLSKAQYNKRKKELLVEDDSKIIPFLCDDKDLDLPENILENKELNSYILEQINSLDSHYKQALILYYYLEQSYEEISKSLDISIGTVKSRLYRAKNLIKDNLKIYKDSKKSAV